MIMQALRNTGLVHTTAIQLSRSPAGTHTIFRKGSKPRSGTALTCRRLPGTEPADADLVRLIRRALSL